MANYHSIKNAGLAKPAASTDLGSSSNKYGNLFLDGNITLGSTVVNSNNVINPKIASISYTGDDTATSIAGGQTVTLNGAGFSSGATVLIGTTPATSTTVVSSTQITFIPPATAAGTYVLYVINSDGGTATFVTGISFSGTPTWTTSAGTLGSFVANASVSISVTATGDAPVTYSVKSGSSLPSGLSLNTSTGAITGTAPTVLADTTYNFTITASDLQNQDTDRAFSLTVTVPVIQGQVEFTTPGTYSWTVPTGVTAISAVVIGGGGGGADASNNGGGAGGGLRYRNAISVTPGESITVVVGAGGPQFSFTNGGESNINRSGTSLVYAEGGQSGRYTRTAAGGGGSSIGGSIGGGNGGNGGAWGGTSTARGGGGGAGGYSGNGGVAGDRYFGNPSAAGSGGGGGGGGSASNGSPAGNGGGVGLLGQGSNGTAGTNGVSSGGNGGAGSGGSGTSYGAGGHDGSAGFGGAARIIWGPNRAYPSTNTANV